MMDSKAEHLEGDVNETESQAAALKQKRLSNGTTQQGLQEADVKATSPQVEKAENGDICNGEMESGGSEQKQAESKNDERHKTKSSRTRRNSDNDDSEVESSVVNGNVSSSDKKSSAVKGDSDVGEEDVNKEVSGSGENGHVNTCSSEKCDMDCEKKGDRSVDCDEKSKCDKSVIDGNNKKHSTGDKFDTGKKDNVMDCDKADGEVEEVLKKDSGSDTCKTDVETSGKDGLGKDDSEKENDDGVTEDNEKSTQSSKETGAKSDKQEAEKRTTRSDSAADDVEIIGESKVIPLSIGGSGATTSQNVVFVPAGLASSVTPLPLVKQGFSASSSNMQATSTMQNTMLVQNLVTSSHPVHSLPHGFAAAGMPSFPPGFVFSGNIPGHQNAGVQNVSLLAPAVAPPKPKSSLDQIELIRWEIQNRINTRPKYFKPNPSSELGPLAKFLFDIGSDLIKESVYHDLVKIQSKKNDDDKLSDKEREDLEKLKEIEKDLYATIGHLKFKLKKRCKVCNFQTESRNVMYLHKQYPHEDNKLLKCAHCTFSAKQPMAFKFHMEAEHTIQPKLHDKKAFFECDMCPYENNQEQKLILHKQRCIKQFRPLFNLHPSCLSGAEINLCLENIFYKPIVPKNLKLLQQKHAQQQAALAEARRQQAQMQALAAQKNAAALAAKKQLQQQQKYQPPSIAPRYTAPVTGRLPLPPKIPGQSMRYNSNSSGKGPRPTVANMLNQRQQSIPTPAANPGGFEVCEICGGYVKDRKALRIHFFYAHRIDLPFNLFERNQAPLYCATCYVRFWTAQGLRKHIDTHKEENQTRGVVGKCISCGHHVLNLLLHMRIVHNREMQHYINALMCMFCGSHFGTRQECERHILKSHGNVDPVTGTLRANSGQPAPQQPQKNSSNQKKSGNNSLVKGSVCVLCNLNFGRNVDLTRHCMRMHHTCMKCGMVVIDKASLMKHTCLSSPSGTRDCAMCGETGFHPAYYVKHLRDKHLKKFSIKVSKVSKNVIERWTKRPYCVEEPKEILVEISDSDEGEDDLPLNKLKPCLTVSSPQKKPRMGPACKVKKLRETVEKTTEESSGVEQKAGENCDTPKAEVGSKEIIDFDSKPDATSSTDEDPKSSESPQSRKRKLGADSPDPDKFTKRKKSSSSS